MRLLLNTLIVGVLFIVSMAVSDAQPWVDTGADAVEFFTEGEGAGFGFTYFPGNVLGLPDSNAREEAPSADPKQVLRLGLGGEIVLRFDRYMIVDGPGPDFTVFENAFYYSAGPNQRTYVEPATVAVSVDGVEYYEFPYDEMTLEGCAGMTPTNGAANPADPSVSGGDAFDLAALGLDSVRFVRLLDVTGPVKGNQGHPFWDPTLNGFELDAVVGVNVTPRGVSGVEGQGQSDGVAVRLVTGSGRDGYLTLELERRESVAVDIYDGLGRNVREVFAGELGEGGHRLVIGEARLPVGYYFVHVRTGEYLQTMRLVVLR